MNLPPAPRLPNGAAAGRSWRDISGGDPPARLSKTPRRNSKPDSPALVIPACAALLVWIVLGGLELSLPIVLGVVNSFICVRQIVLTSNDPGSGPIQLVFWPFTFVAICASSILQLHRGVFPWPDSGQESFFPWAQLLLMLALLAYIVGAKLAPSHDLTARVAEGGEGTEASLRPWIPILIALGLLRSVLSNGGGLSGRFSTRDAVTQSLVDSGLGGDTVRLFFVNRLPGAAALVGVYMATYLWSRARNTRERSAGRTLAWGRWLVALLLVALLANPLSSSRYAAFGAVFALALGFTRLNTVSKKAMTSGMITVGLITAYPLATYFKKTSTQLTVPKFGIDAFTSIDFDGYQQTVNTLSYVKVHGIAYGSHILAAIGYMIPRSVWTGKAIPGNVGVAAERGYTFQNLSLPLWTELYLDLGVVGMVLSMMAFGWLSRRLDTLYSTRPGSIYHHIAVLIAVAEAGLIRGPLGGSVVTFGTVVLLGFASMTRPRRRREIWNHKYSYREGDGPQPHRLRT
jgi:hypothetical protein